MNSLQSLFINQEHHRQHGWSENVVSYHYKRQVPTNGQLVPIKIISYYYKWLVPTNGQLVLNKIISYYYKREAPTNGQFVLITSG